MDLTACSPLNHSTLHPDAIPVTVLTGFLGSGKTTLLNHMLRSRPDMRIAVIENEFGEAGIDHELVIATRKNLFELSNGCACCTVRPELMRILGLLTNRSQTYDHIIIETTGLADPAPVAQTFFVDNKVKQKAHLNTVVTVVDAKHVMRHIEESRACLDQIAFADLILINKCDLVTAEEIERVEERIRLTNAVARIQRVTFGQAPVDEIFDQTGFDLERTLENKPAFLQPEYPFDHAVVYELPRGVHTFRLQADHEDPLGMIIVPNSDTLPELEREATSLVLDNPVATIPSGTRVEAGVPVQLSMTGCGTSKQFPFEVTESGEYALFVNNDPRDFGMSLVDENGQAHTPLAWLDYTLGHAHDDSVTSISLQYEGKLDEVRLGRWLTRLLNDKSATLYRLKGIVDIAGKSHRIVIHGVHSLLNFTEDRPWRRDEARVSRLVFIGRALDKRALKRGFQRCQADNMHIHAAD